jgi:hypothetical protein
MATVAAPRGTLYLAQTYVIYDSKQARQQGFGSWNFSLKRGTKSDNRDNRGDAPDQCGARKLRGVAGNMLHSSRGSRLCR